MQINLRVSYQSKESTIILQITILMWENTAVILQSITFYLHMRDTLYNTKATVDRQWSPALQNLLPSKSRLLIGRICLDLVAENILSDERKRGRETTSFNKHVRLFFVHVRVHDIRKKNFVEESTLFHIKGLNTPLCHSFYVTIPSTPTIVQPAGRNESFLQTHRWKHKLSWRRKCRISQRNATVLDTIL